MWSVAGVRIFAEWLRPVVATCALLAGGSVASAQAVPAHPSFAAAVIRPSAAHVQFERNGRTEVGHGQLRMRDVTVSSAVQWAFGITEGLLTGPASLRGARYDITAKADGEVSEAEMRVMLKTLLRERFGLRFHHEPRTMRVYVLRIAKGGPKMKPARPEEALFRENSATGTVARGMTMKQLAEFLSEPMEAPVTDATGLPGRYDFTIDFTPYVELQRQQGDVKPDVAAVLGMALKGDLGLTMERGQQGVEVMVVDRVETPTEN